VLVQYYLLHFSKGWTTLVGSKCWPNIYNVINPKIQPYYHLALSENESSSYRSSKHLTQISSFIISSYRNWLILPSLIHYLSSSLIIIIEIWYWQERRVYKMDLFCKEKLFIFVTKGKFNLLFGMKFRFQHCTKMSLTYERVLIGEKAL